MLMICVLPVSSLFGWENKGIDALRDVPDSMDMEILYLLMVQVASHFRYR